MRARKHGSLHFQLPQHRPIDGVQEIAAELLPGKPLLIEQRDRITFGRELNGCRRSGRTGAYDGDVKMLHDYLETEITVICR